ncbi:hypothetical protein DPMN_027395 [Dreissena polymorpha]|uniref:Uncharacterized protein n=1 Tax=Dreissena polymorpha TaxID=45954 RepID=A0A9D4LV83_DREPO|nr:hypothetical protein DPMN_027395 [Dreissena polymorpha]
MFACQSPQTHQRRPSSLESTSDCWKAAGSTGPQSLWKWRRRRSPYTPPDAPRNICPQCRPELNVHNTCK